MLGVDGRWWFLSLEGMAEVGHGFVRAITVVRGSLVG